MNPKIHSAENCQKGQARIKISINKGQEKRKETQLLNKSYAKGYPESYGSELKRVKAHSKALCLIKNSICFFQAFKQEMGAINGS